MEVVRESAFWREWSLRKKQIKQEEPKCTCGKKGNPDKGLHFGNCPYLNFWNKAFISFKNNYKPPLTLENFISNTTYKTQAGVVK